MSTTGSFHRDRSQAKNYGSRGLVQIDDSEVLRMTGKRR